MSNKNWNKAGKQILFYFFSSTFKTCTKTCLENIFKTYSYPFWKHILEMLDQTVLEFRFRFEEPFIVLEFAFNYNNFWL